MIDMTKTIEPRSDQANYEDFIAGDRDVTITQVLLTDNNDQPIAIHYQGDNGRPYKPCKSMRRVLVKAWGVDGSQYVGRSMRLYGDSNVTFGGAKVGGIRISHLSHIENDLTMVLSVSRNKRAPYKVHKMQVNVPLEFDSDELLFEARQASLNGLAFYAEWFGKQNSQNKLWLKENANDQNIAHHEALKSAAEQVDNADNA